MVSVAARGSQGGRLSSGSPVFVGGVGGSGTRVVAALLRELGYHIGEDLNESLDNRWFSALFRRPAALALEQAALARLYEAFRAASSGAPARCRFDPGEIESAMLEPRDQHQSPWLRARAGSMLRRLADPRQRALWAWKEPNSHLVAERVLEVDPEARYIHLARNGLDAAFGDNQNQVRFWGPHVLPPVAGEPEAACSLRYWCWAERRARRLAEDHPERVLWIRFEDLCARDERTVVRLASFLGRSRGEVAEQIDRLVAAPPSIGRFRRHGRELFQAADIDYVASLGFPVE
ncbi:MAG: sulfotransferase [Thermoanaerobaculia bacterium]